MKSHSVSLVLQLFVFRHCLRGKCCIIWFSLSSSSSSSLFAVLVFHITCMSLVFFSRFAIHCVVHSSASSGSKLLDFFLLWQLAPLGIQWGRMGRGTKNVNTSIINYALYLWHLVVCVHYFFSYYSVFSLLYGISSNWMLLEINFFLARLVRRPTSTAPITSRSS